MVQHYCIRSCAFVALVVPDVPFYKTDSTCYSVSGDDGLGVPPGRRRIPDLAGKAWMSLCNFSEIKAMAAGQIKNMADAGPFRQIRNQPEQLARKLHHRTVEHRVCVLVRREVQVLLPRNRFLRAQESIQPSP